MTAVALLTHERQWNGIPFPTIRIVAGTGAGAGPSASTCSSACLGGLLLSLRTGCGPKQDWLLGKFLLQPPLRNLDTGGEPNALMSLHVFNHFFKALVRPGLLET